jgi:hypothetical protein
MAEPNSMAPALKRRTADGTEVPDSGAPAVRERLRVGRRFSSLPGGVWVVMGSRMPVARGISLAARMDSEHPADPRFSAPWTAL